MILKSYFNLWPKNLKRFLVITLPALLILACGSGRLPLFSATPTPTPTAMGILFEATVVYLADGTGVTIISGPAEAIGTPTPTATSSLFGLIPPPPTLPPTDTPAFTPTATPKPTNTPLPPTNTPEPVPTIASTAAPAQATTTSDGEIPTSQAITLIQPQEGLALPANAGGLEFKWQWSKESGCRLPDNHGFEVRIWPAAPCCGPLGVMDAVKNQADIACDLETGIRGYRVVSLKDAPGVKATGVGKFLWNVAYIQLEPYTPLEASPPRMFEITLTYTGPLDPFGEDLKCSDFPSWAEAQAVFIAAGGPNQDPHDLDPDKNGIACDELR